MNSIIYYIYKTGWLIFICNELSYDNAKRRKNMYIVKLQDSFGNEFDTVIDAQRARLDGTTLVLSDSHETKILGAFKSWVSVIWADGTKAGVEQHLITRTVATKRKSSKKA